MWKGFVYIVINQGAFRIIWGAYFVVNENRDLLGSSLAHQFLFARQYTTNIFTIFSVIFWFRSFWQVVCKRTYRVKYCFKKNFFMKLFNEFGLEDNRVWNLLQPFCASAECEDNWDLPFQKQNQKSIRISIDVSDPAFSCENKIEDLFVILHFVWTTLYPVAIANSLMTVKYWNLCANAKSEYDTSIRIKNFRAKRETPFV